MLFRLIKALLLCLLVFSNTAWAEDKITAISVEGNRYIETAAILAKIRSQVGDVLSRRQISRDVRKLFATGYFSDVYTEGERTADGIKLIFVVKENPVIASVEVTGNEEITNKTIKQILKMKPGLILSPRLERQTINSIRKKYLSKGFYQSAVNIKTTTLDDGRIDVEVQINEGAVTRVKEIRLIGNEHFSHDELIEALASRASGLGSWFTDSDVFNRDRFEGDAQLLQMHYLEHGFLDVRIESTRLMLTPNMDSFYLALSIHEGEAFTISSVDVQGDVVPSKEKLMEAVALEVGELYAVSKLRKSLETMQEVVGDEGFAFARVNPIFRRDLEKKTVALVFDIQKGPEVYVERIEITGNTKTKAHVIRRELRQHEGERYGASKVRRGEERLRRLSFVTSVQTSKEKTDKPDHVNLNISLEEGKSGTFSAGMNYSQLNGIGVTAKVEEQNLFGEGYRANVSADVGGASNNYSIGLTDPYFIGEDVSGSVSLFRTESDLQSLVSYKYRTEGGSVGIGLALNEYARYSVSYRLTTTTLDGVPATSSLALRSQEGTFTTGELKQSLSYDTRNRVAYPSDGSIQSISLGYAGLTGDHKFYEVSLASYNYFPLTDFWTLKASWQGGTIQGYDGLDAPIYRRYSLGGVGSLRGFDNFGITLLDPATSDVLGGEYRMVTTLDLIFPLPYMSSAGFRGAFFIDAGTVWGESGLVTESFNLSKVRAAYGFGIEWASPVGPLTLSWGFPVRTQTGDKTRSFELAIGRGF